LDWTKSKSILMIALILTNFILLYGVMDSKHAFDNNFDQEAESWSQVIEIGKQKKITFDQPPVFYSNTLQGIRLEYQMYNTEQIAQNLLGTYMVNLGRYQNKLGDEMIFENGNKLLFTKNNAKNPIVSQELDQSVAKIKAEQFLSDIQLSSADMFFWNVQKENGLTTVIFRQYYKKLFLDDAYMAVTFQGSQVIKFERKWFNPPEMLNYSRKIIQPSKALFTAFDSVQQAGETVPLKIKYLELGYRLDSSTLVSSIKAGEASPYWRVLTDKGNVYYIKAQEQVGN
jgi:regulatory protein YycI of two-component signal transduction system YycFG